MSQVLLERMWPDILIRGLGEGPAQLTEALPCLYSSPPHVLRGDCGIGQPWLFKPKAHPCSLIMLPYRPPPIMPRSANPPEWQGRLLTQPVLTEPHPQAPTHPHTPPSHISVFQPVHSDSLFVLTGGQLWVCGHVINKLRLLPLPGLEFIINPLMTSSRCITL